MSGDEHGAAEEPPVSPIWSALAGVPEVEALLGVFVAGLEARVVLLSASLVRGDFKEMAALAHQLRGSAGNFGYFPVAEAAGRIEDCASAGDEWRVLSGLLEELTALCRRVEARTHG